MVSKQTNVSNRTYEAIGRFIFEFSQLEYEIRHRVGEAVTHRHGRDVAMGFASLYPSYALHRAVHRYG